MGSHNDEIKLNVEEAINHLQAAKDLLEKGQLDAAAARASESAFHTATALYSMKISKRFNRGMSSA